MSESRTNSQSAASSEGNMNSDRPYPYTLAQTDDTSFDVKVIQHPIPESQMSIAIWRVYLKQAAKEFKETSQGWNNDLDTLLIFAGLFSAIATAFVIETYHLLQTNPPTGVHVNTLLFSSLILSLVTAFLAMLAKQWLDNVTAHLSPSPVFGGRQRQFRFDGSRAWWMPQFMAFLPILLHISLLLFMVGLAIFLRDLNATVAAVSITIIVVIAIFYVATNVLSVFYPACPYHTSLTSTIFYIGATLLKAGITARRASISFWNSRREAGKTAWNRVRECWNEVGIQWRPYLTAEGLEKTVMSTATHDYLDRHALIWLITEYAPLSEFHDIDILVHSLPQCRNLWILKTNLREGVRALLLRYMQSLCAEEQISSQSFSSEVQFCSNFLASIAVIDAWIICDLTDQAVQKNTVHGDPLTVLANFTDIEAILDPIMTSHAYQAAHPENVGSRDLPTLANVLTLSIVVSVWRSHASHIDSDMVDEFYQHLAFSKLNDFGNLPEDTRVVIINCVILLGFHALHPDRTSSFKSIVPPQTINTLAQIAMHVPGMSFLEYYHCYKAISTFSNRRWRWHKPSDWPFVIPRRATSRFKLDNLVLSTFLVAVDNILFSPPANGTPYILALNHGVYLEELKDWHLMFINKNLEQEQGEYQSHDGHIGSDQEGREDDDWIRHNIKRVLRISWYFAHRTIIIQNCPSDAGPLIRDTVRFAEIALKHAIKTNDLPLLCWICGATSKLTLLHGAKVLQNTPSVDDLPLADIHSESCGYKLASALTSLLPSLRRNHNANSETSGFNEAVLNIMRNVFVFWHTNSYADFNVFHKNLMDSKFEDTLSRLKYTLSLPLIDEVLAAMKACDEFSEKRESVDTESAVD